MDTDELLARFTIPTPCPMDWDRMSGDDRQRYCTACGKHVHNLTAMAPDEIVSLLSPLGEQGGEVCGRVFQRPDGTLVTSECRSGLPRPRLWQFSIRSLMTLIATLAAAMGFTRWFSTGAVRVAGGIRMMPPSVTSGPAHPSCGTGEAAGEDSASPDDDFIP